MAMKVTMDFMINFIHKSKGRSSLTFFVLIKLIKLTFEIVILLEKKTI